MSNRFPLFFHEGVSSEIEMLFAVFSTLGTPDDDIWPGVSSLPNFDEALPTKGKLLFRADENSPGLGKFAVIKSMMSIDKYKSEDADAIKVVAEELEDQLVNLLFNPQHNEKSQKKKIVEEAVWISDDPTVPTGWKISPDSGRFGRCLLSFQSLSPS